MVNLVHNLPIFLIVALMGHNSVGKITMLRTPAGVYTPISGDIVRQGRVPTVLEHGTVREMTRDEALAAHLAATGR